MWLRIDQQVCCRVGRLGVHEFRPGYYAYVGSAFGPGGIAARVNHHRRVHSKPRWHLDYLRGYARPRQVWFSADKRRQECPWASLITNWRGARPIAGFGASDCACPSHLFGFGRPPALANFERRLQALGSHCLITAATLRDQ